MDISTRNKELMYWHKNKNWYTFENGILVPTPEAPERAVRSIDMWHKGGKITMNQDTMTIIRTTISETMDIPMDDIINGYSNG